MATINGLRCSVCGKRRPCRLVGGRVVCYECAKKVEVQK